VVTLSVQVDLYREWTLDLRADCLRSRRLKCSTRDCHDSEAIKIPVAVAPPAAVAEAVIVAVAVPNRYITGTGIVKVIVPVAG
jgi:hypothetical protein